MYAIRSYYEESQLDIDTVPVALDLEEEDIPVLTEVVAPDAPPEAEVLDTTEPVESPADDPMIAVEARITSYNVCYTKLLRESVRRIIQYNYMRDRGVFCENH